MFKSLLFFAGLFCAQIAAAQVSNGLVAKYSFNGGNANDDIGSNHGSVTNATLIPDRFGNANKAYVFVGGIGIPSYITVAHDTAVNFSNSDDFSISYWVKFNANNGTAPMLFKAAATGFQNGYGFSANGTDLGYCNGDGTFFFYTASGAQQDACADTLIANDTLNWIHITGVFLSATQQSILYVNAVSQSDTGGVGTMTGIIANNAPLYFGQFHATASNFSGALDDIRLYRRALSPAEVDSLYNEANPVITNINYAATTLPSAVRIFPNPTQSELHFSQNVDIQLFNIDGKMLQSAQATNKIDINHLPAGLYIAVLRDENGAIIQREKIMKQ